MARKGKSTWKLTGRIKGDSTNYTVRDELDSLARILSAAPYVDAWRQTLKAGIPAAKPQDAILQPNKLVITIYI
jgi:hypothetical protein